MEAYRVSGVLVAHGFESIVSVGALAPTTFHTGLNGYTVDGVGVPAGGTFDGDLQFGLTSDLTAAEVAALRLHVCDTTYDFSAANHVASNSTYTWADDLDWSGETTLTLYLSLPANNPATGTPTITGTATDGQELTATTGTIADSDGLTTPGYTYQWIRVYADGTSNEEDISGEIAATYTLTDDDVGKKVKVKVSFTDDLSGEEERTSAAFPSSGTVTVAGVTDVDEPPDAPATPAVTAVSGSTTSLTVSWAAPANAGRPDIDNYDVQYRAGTSGTWTDGPQNVTTTTATVTGLVANTLYQARVRATNAEGDSGWSSPPGAGRTNALGVAQTRALVSNTGRLNSGHRVVGADEYAQPFDTGNNSGGYSLTGIVLDLQAAPTGTGTLTITVREDSSGDPVRAALYTLDNPALAAGLNEFLAPENAELHANTTYWVVATYSADTGGPTWYRTVRTYGLDAGATAGWAIDAPYKIDGRVAQDGWVVHSLPRTLQIAVKGTVIGAPVLSEATVNGTSLVLTYDEDLDTGSVPLAGDFAVAVAGLTAVVSNVAVSGNTVTLTLATAVVFGQTVTVSYTGGTNPIQDLDGNDAVALFSRAVDNNTINTISVPGAPRNLGATPGDGRVTLTWAAPRSDGGADIVRYDYRHAQGTSVPASEPWLSAGLNLRQTVAGLDNDRQYTFEVRAVNSEGVGPAASVQAIPQLNATVPSAPRFLTATAGDRFVFLAWYAPERTGGSSISDYEYRHAIGASVPDDTPWLSSGGELDVGIRPLENGKRYTFQVRAMGSVAGPAATVTATPSASPEQREPGRPRDVTLSAEAYTDDRSRKQYAEVTLSWNPPADLGNSALERYEYRYAEEGSALDDERWWHSQSGRLSITAKSLKLQTVYVFELRALNLEGPGPAFRTTVRTPAAAAATGLISLHATQSDVAEGGALTFEVRRSANTDRDTFVLVAVTDTAFPGGNRLLGEDGLGMRVVKFKPGATSATGTVRVAFDGARPSSRTVTVSLQSVEEDYYYGTPTTLDIKVNDRDAAVSVRDAQVSEGPGATLEFAVTLDRALDWEVTVKYATSDGTAMAGADYTETSGTLTFAAGERSKTISVPVLDDALDEGSETLILTLSNAMGAVITDASATGTISNSDPLPKGWLARFGRTSATQVLGLLDARFDQARAPASQLTLGGHPIKLSGPGSNPQGGADPSGGPVAPLTPDGDSRGTSDVGNGSAATHTDRAAVPHTAGVPADLAGEPAVAPADPFDALASRYTLDDAARGMADLHNDPVAMHADPAATPDPAAGAVGAGGEATLPERLAWRLLTRGGWSVDRRQFLSHSSFDLSLSALGRETDGEAVETARVRETPGHWSLWGRGALTRFAGRDTGVSLDGDVLTGLLGLDYSRGRWLAGVGLAYNDGDGAYRAPDSGTAGKLDSTLVSVHPYLHYALTDRLSAWGTLGYGAGGLRLRPERDGAKAQDTIKTDIQMRMSALGLRGTVFANATTELALKSDLMWVRTTSAATAGLAGGGRGRCEPGTVVADGPSPPHVGDGGCADAERRAGAAL